MQAIIEYIKNNIDKTIKEPNNEVPYPYSSPCMKDIYTDLFYWDTYFINIGLMILGKGEQVKNNLDNIAYFINRLGYMPNASSLLNRSQPPFFTRAVYEYWHYTGDNNVIVRYVDAIIKEHNFWKEKRTRKFGLNSYYVTDTEEVTLGHYFAFSDRVKEYSDSKEGQLRIGVEIMSIAESGFDFNMRFRTEESNIAASEFIHLDLNCILYDAEIKLSEMLEVVGRREEANEYKNKALIRKELMNQYFLTKDGIYMDYNFVSKKPGSVLSNASLYPYIFGISYDSKGAKKVLEKLELEHGVTCTVNRGDDIYYQWDYPLIWGEMHILDYIGLLNVHLLDDAKRIKNKFMATVEHVFEKEHKLFEKYDGNTGEISNCEYDAPEMLGWTAAAYLYFNNIKD